ncbi:MAG: hypothetical protein ACR2OC_05650 [Solirubrobacterales bacterium]
MKRKLVLAAFAALAAGVAAGCGADDHPNDPRPPAPIEITARVTEDQVAVQPDEFGAGLVNMTISNQTDDPVEISVDGPTALTGGVIAPRQPGNLKVDFEEGEYEVTAGEESEAKPTLLTVGPERASSQNELLLP